MHNGPALWVLEDMVGRDNLSMATVRELVEVLMPQGGMQSVTIQVCRLLRVLYKHAAAADISKHTPMRWTTSPALRMGLARTYPLTPHCWRPRPSCAWR